MTVTLSDSGGSWRFLTLGSYSFSLLLLLKFRCSEDWESDRVRGVFQPHTVHSFAAIFDRKLLPDHNRILSDTILVPQLQLPLLLLFLLLSVFLLYTNLHSIVENFTDQLCLRNDVLLDSWYFGYILWLRRLSMQEWYEDAHL